MPPAELRLPELSALLAPWCDLARREEPAVALNLIYCWVMSRGLHAGSSLADLEVHPTTEVRDELARMRAAIGGQTFAPVDISSPTPLNDGALLTGFVDGHAITVAAGEYLVGESNAVSLHRVRLNSNTDGLALGAQSSAPLADYATRCAGRLYLNLPFDHAPEFYRDLVAALDRTEAPWEIKWFIPREAARRADATVIYFGLDLWRSTVATVARIVARHSPTFREDVPALAWRLDTGLALAVAQSAQRSFGEEIADLLTECIRTLPGEAPADALQVAITDALVRVGRDPAQPYARTSLRRGFGLDDARTWYHRWRTWDDPFADSLIQAFARGGPMKGSPMLLNSLAPLDANSSATAIFESAADIYSGSAGWHLALPTELRAEIPDLRAGTGSAPWRHGYLSGSIGTTLARSEHATLPNPARDLPADLMDGAGWDLSSGLAGTVAGLAELISKDRGMAESALPVLSAYATILLRTLADADETHSPGMAHGLAGGAWALFVASAALDRAELRSAAHGLVLRAQDDNSAVGAWCRGGLAVSIARSIITGVLDPRALDLTHKAVALVAPAEPSVAVDGTLCHGLSGLLEMTAVLAALRVPGIDPVRASLATVDPGTTECKVGHTPSAGLFDGPLGLYFARSRLGRTPTASPLFPGWRSGH